MFAYPNISTAIPLRFRWQSNRLCHLAMPICACMPAVLPLCVCVSVCEYSRESEQGLAGWVLTEQQSNHLWSLSQMLLLSCGSVLSLLNENLEILWRHAHMNEIQGNQIWLIQVAPMWDDEGKVFSKPRIPDFWTPFCFFLLCTAEVDPPIVPQTALNMTD